MRGPAHETRLLPSAAQQKHTTKICLCICLNGMLKQAFLRLNPTFALYCRPNHSSFAYTRAALETLREEVLAEVEKLGGHEELTALVEVLHTQVSILTSKRIVPRPTVLALFVVRLVV